MIQPVKETLLLTLETSSIPEPKDAVCEKISELLYGSLIAYRTNRKISKDEIYTAFFKVLDKSSPTYFKQGVGIIDGIRIHHDYKTGETLLVQDKWYQETPTDCYRKAHYRMNCKNATQEVLPEYLLKFITLVNLAYQSKNYGPVIFESVKLSVQPVAKQGKSFKVQIRRLILAISEPLRSILTPMNLLKLIPALAIIIPLEVKASTLCDYDKEYLTRVLDQCKVVHFDCENQIVPSYECRAENSSSLKLNLAIGFGMYVDKQDEWEYSEYLAKRQFECFEQKCADIKESKKKA